MTDEQMNESHVIKIPKSEYETLLEAKQELMKLGYQKLPNEVIQRARFEAFVQGRSAGMAQGRSEGFTQGAVVVLGLAALLYLLREN